MVRIQHFRKVLLWCCLIVGASITLRSFIFYPSMRILVPYWKRNLERPLACLRPNLELSNPLINSFFTFTPDIKCGEAGESDWICIKNGSAQTCDPIPETFPPISCNYTFFQRVDDQKTFVAQQFQNVSGKVSMPTDFFHVNCNDAKERQWKSVMAGIHRDDKVLNASSFAKLHEKSLKLNVLMFGFDSLSRLTFIRKLPRTYRYLTEVLGAVVLQGYNIVGDGTPQALIPILTGRTETELPETRKRMGHAQHVNVYPFVWNEYKKNGYVTAFAEDTPGIGAFTYRLMGFGEQPTDHYMRTFYMEAENYFSEHKKFCLGNRPRHKVMMDYVEDYFDFYHDKPKFMFAFHGELSHDDFNLIGSADNDTLRMLMNLKEKGHLENTLLILMSDHGHRFAQIRETQQGKQEERLPFFSIALPSWFEKKYPKGHKNLVVNSNRLTSPFDIHPTLLSILNFDDRLQVSTKTRSINLFLQVPENRTCEDADIEAHWCTCLDWEPVNVDDSVAKLAGQALVNYINNITAAHRQMCAVLELKEISRVEKYVPQLDLLRFKKNADMDGFVGDFSDNTLISQVIYQVKLTTMPGFGHFESSLEYDVKMRSFTVKSDLISRINAYGRDAACIIDTQQDLRKFCYCLNQVQ